MKAIVCEKKAEDVKNKILKKQEGKNNGTYQNAWIGKMQCMKKSSSVLQQHNPKFYCHKVQNKDRLKISAVKTNIYILDFFYKTEFEILT